ncbi:hypothetical protein GCM10010215_15050 [Streptomyces virginiae]|uniref:Uncharacterized protein n=1 Tax=Streptomyces virginiae TaxID=1961 RepID=A0ABQ3NVF0_STRVG|nr:hypothetical protein GCM10010215_15050 [Streptomyces virginiae]GHI16733.1 hypothetical protein Scinn_61960 [Streptomyces virginiae]
MPGSVAYQKEMPPLIVMGSCYTVSLTGCQGRDVVPWGPMDGRLPIALRAGSAGVCRALPVALRAGSAVLWPCGCLPGSARTRASNAGGAGLVRPALRAARQGRCGGPGRGVSSARRVRGVSAVPGGCALVLWGHPAPSPLPSAAEHCRSLPWGGDT